MFKLCLQTGARVGRNLSGERLDRIRRTKTLRG
jgi:hypothetical protein